MSHTVEQIQAYQRALTTFLDHVSEASAGSFAEPELIRGIVEEYGNGGFLWGPLLALPDNPPAATAPIPGFGAKRPTHVSINGLGDEIEAQHADFRRALKAIVDGRVNDDLRNTVAVGRRRVAQVGNYYAPENRAACLSFALALLLDPLKGYGPDLRQCQLSTGCGLAGRDPCERFFFVSTRPREPGKRNVGVQPDKYCCPDHAKKAHNLVKNRSTALRREKERIERERKAKLAAAKHK